MAVAAAQRLLLLDILRSKSPSVLRCLSVLQLHSSLPSVKLRECAYGIKISGAQTVKLPDLMVVVIHAYIADSYNMRLRP